MKFAAAKNKKWLVGLSSCLAVAMVLVPAVAAKADTYPYFKEYGADVAAGGWFNGGALGGCSSAPDQYQYPGYNSANGASNLTGGILTYANTKNGKANGGASSQYGAFALGAIDTTASTPANGFYSAGAQRGSSSGQLSFANIGSLPSSSSGGNFGGGGEPDDQCITDYYDDAQRSPTAFSGNLADLASGQYSVDASSGTYTLNGGTIASGQNVAIFVNGNVYIPGNITYAFSGNANDAAKFALVTRGNIYIGSGVTQLDGWYIAQPAAGGTPSTNNGVIWTCRDDTSSATSVDSSFVSNNCGKQLVINGALTAKHVNFLRIGGNVVVADTTSDGSATDDSNAAEVINYTPDVVLGGPFFDLPPGAPKIESLVSLPPIF